MDMGQKIKKLREEKGLTLEELGNMVGVGKSTIRKWETGMIANMKRDKISKVANALKCSPAYLMGWEEEVSKDSPVSTTESCEKQTPKCTAAMNLFNELNDEGQERAIDNMVLLKKVYPRVQEPLLNAAHERTDTEVTDEMKQHDNAIMDDENF